MSVKHPADRVVIVGAGPGGLASAMLLAKAGVEVTVVEKRGTVGGRTSTFEAEGFRFDVGPTFFLYPQVLREIVDRHEAGGDRQQEVWALVVFEHWHRAFVQTTQRTEPKSTFAQMGEQH